LCLGNYSILRTYWIPNIIGLCLELFFVYIDFFIIELKFNTSAVTLSLLTQPIVQQTNTQLPTFFVNNISHLENIEDISSPHLTMKMSVYATLQLILTKVAGKWSSRCHIKISPIFSGTMVGNIVNRIQLKKYLKLSWKLFKHSAKQ